jgi:4-amino-4-deoxy-L-arabinose transferase-like glycosyltransferase
VSRLPSLRSFRPFWLPAAMPLILWPVVALRDHFFRDELYYIALGRHLDIGYVDIPMLTAVLAAVSHALFGDSLLGLRLLPAFAGSATVALTALTAAEMGGGAPAQLLAALGALVAPVFLATNTLFGPDVFDRLVWIAGAYVLVMMLRSDDPTMWPGFGAIAAIGLLTKLTVVFWGAAVVLGLLLAGRRRLLTDRWVLAGGAIAVAGLLPYVIWQILHGWPSLEFWSRYGGKLAELSSADFVLQQVLGMNPFALPLWGIGLYALLFGGLARPFRPLGISFLILFAFFLATRAKSYFLAPAYPALLAAGAVTLAGAGPAIRRFTVAPYTALLALSGALMAVVAMPLLPPEVAARVMSAMGPQQVQQERLAVAELPQYLADRYGWEEMVAAVADVYRELPPDERSRACIFMMNYGRAAAIDFYGPRYGLPKAISGHNNYFLWGLRGCTGRVVITTGAGDRALAATFDRIEQVATITCAYCMPYENQLPVWVARDPKMPGELLWPSMKHYD